MFVNNYKLTDCTQSTNPSTTLTVTKAFNQELSWTNEKTMIIMKEEIVCYHRQVLNLIYLDIHTPPSARYHLYHHSHHNHQKHDHYC